MNTGDLPLFRPVDSADTPFSLLPVTATDIALLRDALTDAEEAVAQHGDLLPTSYGNAVLPEDDPERDTSDYGPDEHTAIDLIRAVRALQRRLDTP